MKKQDIKELMKYFSGMENISKMKLKQEDIEIELEKEVEKVLVQEQVSVAPAVASIAPEVSVPAPVQTDTKPQNCITSPMVGTFYQAPAPGAAVFAKVGDSISKGQTVAIIEAMKIMNEIEAEYDCKIKKILVEDGQPVEFDMPLFEVERL